MTPEQLKTEIKQIIVDECDIDIDAHDIEDDEILMGEDTRLALDSLDALSIALEVKARFGKHIDSGNETRLALRSVNSLAEFIRA